MTDRIRILFLAANPVNTSHIRLDQEVREIEEKINSAKLRDRFLLIPQLAARTTDLHQALLRHQPHIVHFSGHGSETQGIILEDNLGRCKPVSSKVLAELFAILPDYIRIVVLNACYSRRQASSISRVIDYTIGMKDKIGDQSAILFSSSFYLALAYGRSVKEAFSLGVHSIKQEGLTDDSIPALLVKEGADASKSFPLFPQAESAGGSKGGVEMGKEHLLTGNHTSTETAPVSVSVSDSTLNSGRDTIVAGNINHQEPQADWNKQRQ